jgi:hypothetical protein
MNSVLRTFVLGGVLGAGVVSGGALALAQTADQTVPPATAAPGTAPDATATPPAATPPGTTPAPSDKADPGRPGRRGAPGGGRPGGHHRGGHEGIHQGVKAAGEDLAKELGVPVEQLRAATKAARQVVADQLGKPGRPAGRPATDEDKAKRKADLKARGELFTRTLAEKLNITPERLREARTTVMTRRVEEAVTSGRITRERADKILARIRERAGS